MMKQSVFLLAAILSLSFFVHAESRPNIVCYFSDDMSRADSSVYGSKDVNTPQMDRLAELGMVFDYAFIASPACAPSRAAMLTGLMPARNGAEANHTYPKPGMLYLTKVLKEIGYEVISIGKVAHGINKERANQMHLDFFSPNPRQVAEQAREYFDKHEITKPVCLLVGDRRPHVPWIKESIYDPEKISLPPTLIDTFETRQHRARYYTDTTGVDEEMGQVFDLAKEQFGDNFVFLFTSDHGAQWPFGKWNLYDEGIRVPFMMVWPGKVKPGTRTDAMVSWIDIFPTFIDIAGGTQPKRLDGKPFTDVLLGKSQSHRDVIFTTHSGDGVMNVYPIRSLRDRRYKYIENLLPDCYHTNHSDILRKDGAGAYWDSWDKAAETDPKAKAVIERYCFRPAVEFFDLQADPYELHNLAKDPMYQERIQNMATQLDEWMKEQGDQKTVFNDPYPKSKPKPTKEALNK